jgi:hypothetical protein
MLGTRRSFQRRVKIIVLAVVFTFDFDRRARFHSQLAVFLSNCELFLVFSSMEMSILSYSKIVLIGMYIQLSRQNFRSYRC